MGFGQRAKEYARELHVQGQTLAEAVGVQPSYISHILSETRTNISPHIIRGIINTLVQYGLDENRKNELIQLSGITTNKAAERSDKVSDIESWGKQPYREYPVNGFREY